MHGYILFKIPNTDMDGKFSICKYTFKCKTANGSSNKTFPFQSHSHTFYDGAHGQGNRNKSPGKMKSWSPSRSTGSHKFTSPRERKDVESVRRTLYVFDCTLCLIYSYLKLGCLLTFLP